MRSSGILSFLEKEPYYIMYSVGIIADDLTGAMDTSQGFAARDYDTTVLVNPSANLSDVKKYNDSSVLGVNTESRYTDEKQAADSVFEAVTTLPTRMVYKKVDSTLRGNFVSEVDAALSASKAAFGLVAPAFPSAGRTTKDGIHYLNGTPIAKTDYRNEEKGPSSSSLAELFESIDRPTENIYLSTIESGPEHVMSAVTDILERTNQPPILICDACEKVHLATIAEASAEFDVLYIGSGGLAEHLRVHETETNTLAPPQIPSGAPLGVAGSVNETTLAQLEYVPDKAVIELDGVALLSDDSSKTAVKQAVRRLEDHQPVVLTAATDSKAVKRTLAAGQERGLSSNEIRDRVATQLAETATCVLQRETPSGLVATGGSIAIATVQSLNATTVSLTGEEVAAGIPIGQFMDGSATGMAFITKAGGFGKESTIVNCLDTLTRTHEQ